MELDHYNRIKKHFKYYEVEIIKGQIDKLTFDELIECMYNEGMESYKLDKGILYVYGDGTYEIK